MYDRLIDCTNYYIAYVIVEEGNLKTISFQPI